VPNLRAATTPTALVVRISTGPPSLFLPPKCEVSNWSVDPGVPPQEPQEDNYSNNEDIMDYEEPPASAQAPAQAQPRQGQDRHQEPRRKRHGHR
jgi:hypothetical protein